MPLEKLIETLRKLKLSLVSYDVNIITTSLRKIVRGVSC